MFSVAELHFTLISCRFNWDGKWILCGTLGLDVFSCQGPTAPAGAVYPSLNATAMIFPGLTGASLVILVLIAQRPLSPCECVPGFYTGGYGRNRVRLINDTGSVWRKKTDEEEGEKRGRGGGDVMRMEETFRRYLRKIISDGWKMMVHQAPISSSLLPLQQNRNQNNPE